MDTIKTNPSSGERAERPWFMWTEIKLNALDRLKLLLGWRRP